MSIFKFSPVAGAAVLAVSMLGGVAASATVNLAPTASVTDISSFFNFSFYSIGLVGGGQATAQENLLTGALTAYTTNNETRYIFADSDQTPFVVIKLAAAGHLKTFGATWFDAAYSDRAPAKVTFSVSSDGLSFADVGSYVTGGLAGGGNLVTLASAVTGQYVKYSFDVTGAVNVGNAVAIASLSVTAVPEPASWALLIAGFSMVGVAARRRTRIAA